MNEVQEHLVRAGAIARLEAILMELEHGKSDVPQDLRDWFVELLHPFNGEQPGKSSLQPSTAVPHIEAGAILSVLLGRDEADLEVEVQRLIALRSALLAGSKLSDAEIDTARETARQLRVHFVGDDTPAPPEINSLR